MRAFIKEVMSEEGRPSSKRVTLFILLTLFVVVLSYSLVTGKKPDETLGQQLFYMLLYVLGLVFGSNLINANKDIKISQANPSIKTEETKTEVKVEEHK